MRKIALLVVVCLLCMLVNTHADVIVLDSGKSIEGEIIEETLDEIVVRLPSGVVTRIDRDEVVEIKRSDELEKEYQKKYKEIMPGDTYAMMELAKWCRQRGLKKHQRELLEEILKSYPDDSWAKRELDILDGKLPESARDKEIKPDGMTWTPGKGPSKKKKKKSEPGGKPAKDESASKPKIEKLWQDDNKKGRSSKYKPKGATAAGFKGLDWLMKNGTTVKYAPQGQVVSAGFAGMAALASRNNKYSPLVERCVKSVQMGIKRYLTGKRENPGQFTQSNWALSIGGLFLAEAQRYYKSAEMKKMLAEICKQLVINLEPSGGWGHDASGPNPLGYVELEIMSNFAVACMGICKRQKIPVPIAKLEEAVRYIEKCITGAGVGYSHTNKWGHVSRTGGAIYALSMAGATNVKGFSMLCKQLDSGMKSVIGGHASNALAFLQCAAGSLQLGPAVWDKYVQTWFKTIMDNQNPDGSFHPIKHPKEDIKAEHNMGPAYCTGIYSFVLLVDRGGLKFTSGCYRMII